MVCHSQLSEVLLPEGPRYAPVQQGFRHLGLQQAHLRSKRGSLQIVQLPLESTVACPCESDPSFDFWHNIGACVGKTAQVYTALFVYTSLFVGSVRCV